jgi:biotin carboxyl carrier protein
MRFEVEINGRMRGLTVERTGVPGQFRVAVDGAGRLIDAARVEDRTWSLLIPEEGSTSWRASITDGARPGELVVQIGGASFAVAVNGRRSRHVAAGDAAPEEGAQRIVATMPGKVVRVLVQPGDHVAPGQSVIVVEAMKMENEFRAQKSGTVKEVFAQAGASVEAGRTLVVIE